MIPPYGYGYPMGMPMGMPMGVPMMPPGYVMPPGYPMPVMGYGPPPGWVFPAASSAPSQPGGTSLWEEKMAQMRGESKWDQKGPAGSSKWDVGGPGDGDGKVLFGTVKSYSSIKGYGFIVTPEIKQDVWFAEESIDAEMRTNDLAGESIRFELMRAPDGKPQARRVWFVRPAAPARPSASPSGGTTRMPPMTNAAMLPPKPSMGVAFMGKGGPAVQFNPSGVLGCRDGTVIGVGKQPASIAAVVNRSLSPHAGSRAMKTVFGAAAPPIGTSRSRSRKRSRSSSSRSSSSSSSSSSRRKKKRKKKKAKKSDSDNEAGVSSTAAVAESEEVAQAKADALQKLTGLQKIEAKDARMKEYRALLRTWHPDKNPDRLEIATAVFQFLQKGKKLITP